MTDKNVLIISYYFVPYNISGVFRILRLSKYLPDTGWIPHVLTIRESEGMRNIDHELYHLVNPVVHIHRTTTIDPQLIFFRYGKNYILKQPSPNKTNLLKSPSLLSKTIKVLSNMRGKFLRLFLFPDPQVLWLPFALIRGYRVIKQNNIQTILATGGPWTDFLVGYFLSILTRKKLILDYRDLWTTNKVVTYPTVLHKKLAQKLEALIIKRAVKVISVTEMMTQGFMKAYRRMADKFVTITNGFDPAQFGAYYTGMNDRPKTKFRMAYAGTFYLKRRPETFLRALYDLLLQCPDLRQEIEFVFIGDDYQNALHGLVEELHLSDVVIKSGFMSYSNTHMELQKADIVVLIVPPDYKEEITSKVFEYFIAQKPILAVVPEDGSAAGLIQETRTGVVASVDNIEDIKNKIMLYFDQWKNNTIKYNSNELELEKYDMKKLASSLALLLQDVKKN